MAGYGYKESVFDPSPGPENGRRLWLLLLHLTGLGDKSAAHSDFTYINTGLLPAGKQPACFCGLITCTHDASSHTYKVFCH
ncbi:hypothetical protein ABBQ38_006858 [Trebouxia sp. C0009 RCD-2024]